jgi:protocatechuate 3,4-dioxygenase beta subunit
MDETSLTRRRFLEASAVVPLAFVVGCGEDAATPAGTTGSASSSASATLSATPSCDDGDDPTPEQTEGPYFTPGSPLRRDLTRGVDGRRLVIAGAVMTPECRPVRRALLDFWQADADGQYDNEGFRLRGHQFTDDRGRFRLVTVVPGLYPGRTRHLHVKVQRRGGPVLTTQLYFPGEAQNRSDGIFDDALVMAVRRDGALRRARFDFVLD